jgi:hypothetical protein
MAGPDRHRRHHLQQGINRLLNRLGGYRPQER